MKNEYSFDKMKEIKNPYPSQKKKAVGINLSPSVIDYFKKLSDETGFSYQKLIDLHLLDCVKNKKKLSMNWSSANEATCEALLLSKSRYNKMAEAEEQNRVLRAIAEGREDFKQGNVVDHEDAKEFLQSLLKK